MTSANPPGRTPTAIPDDSQPESSTDPNLTATSLSDSGLSNRPRDARLLHMVLASYGVTAYQERVPLMLMDFAYRYTSATLSDALHFSSEGYGFAGASGTGRGAGGNTLSDINLPALRLSIHSRSHYQYSPNLPTTVYTELAQERNKVALPPLKKEWGAMLPPEQYCLMGNGFSMEEDGEDTADEDTTMKDDQEGEENEIDGDEAEGGRMEDIFGEGINGVGGDEMET